MEKFQNKSPDSTYILSKKPLVEIERCYHCHDKLPHQPIVLLDKQFCCDGCKMVFEILNTNDLCTYYDLNEAPGTSQRNRKEIKAWAFLDDDEIQQKLLQYSDDNLARVTFLVPQMHCASCLYLLEHLYRLDSGIQHSKVNFLKKEVIVQYNPQKTTLRKVASMLSGIGYAPEINLGDLENPLAKPLDRSIYYKLGLAGFAFGNIMLLSFPEYLGLDKMKDSWFFMIFGYLNLLLATPVLLYSARDYLISAYNGLKNSYLNIDVPLSLGIVVLYGRSVFEIFTQTGAGYLDSFTGLIFFLLIGRWYQQKTYYHLSFERDYKSYFPISATVRRAEGHQEVLAVNKLEPGDIISIKNQEILPADGILIKGRANMDYSFVTGEADPQPIPIGEKLFAGGRQLGETIEVTLTRKVSQSYLTQLWNDEAFLSGTKSHASLLADKAGRYFTVVILLVAFGALLYWVPRDMHSAINAFTAVLITACPCAVALSIPFTLGNILRILGKHGFYVKNTQVLESFQAINQVVFDKTGTITLIHNEDDSHANWYGKALSYQQKSVIASLVAHSTHPVSKHITFWLKEQPLHPVEEYNERLGDGISGIVNDVPVWIGKRSFLPSKDHNTTLDDGTYVQIGETILGCYKLRHTYRNGLHEVVDSLGVRAKLWLLSGDNEKEKYNVRLYFPDEGNLLFHQSPHDKLQFVKKLQGEGNKVLMLGDGLNDAGALKAADVGIVVSENTNNFTPACDAILDGSKFTLLPRFIALAQEGTKLVNRSFLLAACYNIVGLSYAVTGTLSPVVAAILMPLSSLTIILYGVLGSSWKAKILMSKD